MVEAQSPHKNPGSFGKKLKNAGGPRGTPPGTPRSAPGTPRTPEADPRPRERPRSGACGSAVFALSPHSPGAAGLSPPSHGGNSSGGRGAMRYPGERALRWGTIWAASGSKILVLFEKLKIGGGPRGSAGVLGGPPRPLSGPPRRTPGRESGPLLELVDLPFFALSPTAQALLGPSPPSPA